MHRLAEICTGFAGCARDPITATLGAISGVASSGTLATAGSMAGIGTSLFGSIMGARGAKAAGQQTLLDKLNFAEQSRNEGNADLANYQRTMEGEQRKTALTESTLNARAAAQGGDTTDSGVINLAGKIQNMGDFNALAALTSGLEQKQHKDYAADVAVQSGLAARSAGQRTADATLVGGVANGFAKFAQANPFKGFGLPDSIQSDLPGTGGTMGFAVGGV